MSCDCPSPADGRYSKTCTIIPHAKRAYDQEQARRNGCTCSCCDHAEGSDCGCDCHRDWLCGARVPSPPEAPLGPRDPQHLEALIRARVRELEGCTHAMCSSGDVLHEGLEAEDLRRLLMLALPQDKGFAVVANPSENAVCPACVLGNPPDLKVRLCVTHAAMAGERLDPTNHHNALTCPYCNPHHLTFTVYREAVEALLAYFPNEEMLEAIAGQGLVFCSTVRFPKVADLLKAHALLKKDV